MSSLHNLSAKEPAQDTSITLWAEDEATAQRLATDEYFLSGVLMSDGSSVAKNFQEALGKGGSLSHKIFRNLTRGGYNVQLTVTPSVTVSESKEVLKDDLRSLISQLDHADVEVRGRAAESLGRLGDPKAIRPLYRLMRSESQRFYEAGMSALESNPPDFTRVDELREGQVHTKAANALKSIGNPAIPTLVEALQVKSHRFLRVRAEAARVLGELKAAEAVGPLIGLLTESDKWYDVKKIAVEALENIGGPEAEQAAKAWRSKNKNQDAG